MSGVAGLVSDRSLGIAGVKNDGVESVLSQCLWIREKRPARWWSRCGGYTHAPFLKLARREEHDSETNQSFDFVGSWQSRGVIVRPTCADCIIALLVPRRLAVLVHNPWSRCLFQPDNSRADARPWVTTSEASRQDRQLHEQGPRGHGVSRAP